ncbi:hypothetical protein ACIBEF_12820 [Micromonospora sp. NPDC050795]|uniref:hypothetical protein n=1 Tax=Micromonospora sp. NPDC050795 TaxID=3364282 RepID=UPI0037A7A5C8
MYDRVREQSTQVSGAIPTALKKVNTAARLLQAYTRLGLPNACEPAVDSSNLPGDPLGDCLITSARSRANTLLQRYEVWADQMTAGLHRERVPWINDTLLGLRITTRLTHAN